MKKIAAIILSAASLAGLTACSNNKDSVKQAQEQNQNSAIDEDISNFMTEAADARMMDIEEGKLAKERGSTTEIREYGEQMITDHTKLMHDLKVLAASKNITLPNTLSNEKTDGLEDLKKEQGEDFDKKFIKMITTDHKRDVRAFEDATDFKDKDVQSFATRYLPVIESHLDKIQQIKKDDKNISKSDH
jgi:putative membrane protein